ncbi:MAG: aminotransferase class I/II-fold pyridoxal phosphate-dependent enzyme [Rhodothermales bacterium]|nr:aminotransferase class I/II-fold pyridoxal phosphate-dependent enzyme [Rhodothermales bacterium]
MARSDLRTRLAHAGCVTDPATAALTPPLHLATTFERPAGGDYGNGYVYARWGNPTRDLFERTLADLEGDGAEAAAFASGMAAVQAVLQALRPGDHVLLPDDVYHGVRHLLRSVFADWGLAYSEVDQTDLGAVAAAVRPETRLVWAETPSNPLLKITDLRALAEIARAHDALLLVDGTWTTPLLQRPLGLGADLVLHSATKYLGGHSDALVGAVVARPGLGLFERVRALQQGAGAVADPFSCWLVLRGMRSLGARMPLHTANALRLAEWLAAHPRVEAVHYPGLPGHPGHALASEQMGGFGGMLAFQVRGGAEEALAVAARVRTFRRATSLGGTESLIEHRASIESQPTPTPPNLLRVSVGLEAADDLVADLEEALKAG